MPDSNKTTKSTAAKTAYYTKHNVTVVRYSSNAHA